MRIFGRKQADTTPKSFDRTARDNLRRRPVGVISSDDKVMLIGDSRGEFFLVEPSSMRVVLSIKRGVDTYKKLGKRIALKY